MASKGRPDLEMFTYTRLTYLFRGQYVRVSVRLPGKDREQPAVQLFELSESSQHGPLLPDRTIGNLHHTGSGSAFCVFVCVRGVFGLSRYIRHRRIAHRTPTKTC